MPSYAIAGAFSKLVRNSDQQDCQQIPDVAVQACMHDTEIKEGELERACRRRDLFLVQALLRDRANPNEMNSVRETPLLEAASGRDFNAVNLVALLLAHRADPTIRTAGDMESANKELSPEMNMLFRMVRDRKVESAAAKALLASLEPAANSYMRRTLRLPGPPPRLGGRAPVDCIGKYPKREVEATADHTVTFYLADNIRPVLILEPIAHEADAVIVMLHGLFQSGCMLERFARNLSRCLPTVRLVAPTAPTRATTFGYGPAWDSMLPTDSLAQSMESGQEIFDVIQLYLDGGIMPERIVVLGFSQGGLVAANTSLSHDEGLGGLVLLGTPLIGDLQMFRAMGLPVLVQHGLCDTMAKVEQMYHNVETLKGLGCNVQLLTHEGVGHFLTPEMVDEVHCWLKERLRINPVQPEQTAGSEDLESSFEVSSQRTEYFWLDAGTGHQSDLADTGWTAKEDGKKREETLHASCNVSPTTSSQFFNMAEDSDDDNKGTAAHTCDAENFYEWSQSVHPSSENLIEKKDGVGVRQLFISESRDDGNTLNNEHGYGCVQSNGQQEEVEEEEEMAERIEEHGVKKAAYLLVSEGHDSQKQRDSDMLTGSVVENLPSLEKAAPGIAAVPCAPLAVAARKGDVQEVKRLLRLAVDPHVQCPAGETPLFAAARGGHASAVALLLLGKSDPACKSCCDALAEDYALDGPTKALLQLATGNPVRAALQYAAFAALDGVTRFLLADKFDSLGIRLAVEDVLSESEWIAALAR